MSVTRGLVAFLEAKPDKAEELGAFLQQGRELAAAEEGTVTWYAFRVSETTFGIFEPSRPRTAARRMSTARSPRRSVGSAEICWRRTPTSARSTSSP